jgi:hypothetical protein
VNAAAGYYEASWNLMDVNFTTRRTYRIRVLQGTSELGAVSVDVVRGRWGITGLPGTLVPLMSATNLPIRFGISLPPGAVTLVADANGGRASSGDGLWVSVSAGAVNGRFRIDVIPTPGGAAQYVRLSDTGFRLRVSLLTPDAQFQAGNVLVRLPTSAMPPSSTPHVSATVNLIPGEALWGDATLDPAGGGIILRIPTTGLSQLESVFSTTSVEITVVPQAIPRGASLSLLRELSAPSAGSEHQNEAGRRGSIASAVGVVSCTEYPKPREPLRWAADFPDSPGLHRARRAKALAADVPAIIFVHGWLPEVQNCADFQSTSRMPAETYMYQLDHELHEHFDKVASILSFSYPTFNTYSVAGSALAAAVKRLKMSSRASGVAIIAHSMGGLVAHAAAEQLQKDASTKDYVLGIITLGSPLRGTLAADLGAIFGFLGIGPGNEGSNSLVGGVSSINEPVPIYAYSGNVLLRNPLSLHTSDRISSLHAAAFCASSAAYCLGNDGTVGVFSAAGRAAPFLPSFIQAGGIRDGGPLSHWELHLGRGRLGDDVSAGGDASLFASIVADVNALLARAPVGGPLPNAGLLAHYMFVGNADDASGNGRNGQVFGATLVADRYGQANGAYRFTGTARVSLPSPVLSDIPKGTVSVWMRAETFGDGGVVLTKTSGRNYYQLDLIGGNLVRFYLDNTDLRSETPLTVGRWYMVTTTWDGMEKRLYIDGRLDKQVASTARVPAVDLGVVVGNLGGGGSPMKGSVDDVRVYNRALSGPEVEALYASTAPPLPVNGLIGHYPLDGNATDASGSGLHGVAQNVQTVVDRAGLPNRALRFTGIASRFDVAIPPGAPVAFTTAQQFSLSMWIKADAWPPTADPVLPFAAGRNSFSWHVQIRQDGRPFAAACTPTEFCVSTPVTASVPAMTLGRWFHLVQIYDGVGRTLRLYVDGQLVGSVGTGFSLRTTDQRFFIGTEPESPLKAFLGSIDEVRIYNRLLTPQEVAALAAR